MTDFIDILAKQAANQNNAPLPDFTTENDLLNRGRLLQIARDEQQKKRESQPSYYEARKLFNNEDTQSIISDPRPENAFKLQQAAEKIDPQQAKEDLDGIFGGHNFFTKFIFGSGIPNDKLGKDMNIGESLASRGVLGFFTGQLLRSTPESEAQVYEVLLDAGADPKEAFKKAQDVVAGRASHLTPEEAKAVHDYEAWDTAFRALDAGFLALDTLTLGTAGVARPLLKRAARAGVSTFIKAAEKATTRSELRNLIAEAYPELRGTKELEKMIDIVKEYPKDFSLFKAREEFKRTKTFNQIAETANPTKIEAATPAQQILYENGIPVLRKTTPESLLKRRQEAIEAVKGNREGLRLSNPDILHQEIQAGSVPLKTTPDSIVEAFRVAPRGRRLKVGEELSLSEKFAEAIKEGGKIEKVQVPVKDLVRQSDGTFTYAPERLIKESPIIKFPTNIPKKIVEEAKQLEKKRMAEKLAKQEAERKAREEAIKKAQAELERPAKEAQARLKALEEKKTLIKTKTQARINKEQNLVTGELGRIRTQFSKEVSKIDTQLRKAKQEESLIHIKKLDKAKTKLQKQKEKIRYQNKIARLTERAKKQKEKLKQEERKAIIEAKNKSKRVISELKKQQREDLKKISQEIKNTKPKVRAIVKTVEKSKETASVKTITKTIEKSENSTIKTSTKKGSGKALNPVGEGNIKESKLFKSVYDNVREERKKLGDVINDKDYEFYRVATNKEQLEKAATYIEQNGVEDTIKSLIRAYRTGNEVADGILNNSLLIALEPMLLKEGMAKYAQELTRLASKIATRSGQEIQILSTLKRNNPLVVLTRLQDSIEKMVVKKGAREEAEKIMNRMLENIDVEGTLKEAVDAIKICKS